MVRGAARLWLLLALLVPLVGCPARPAPETVDRPNIVLVIGDDHGYPYFGFMGDPVVRTPNLDRLADGGTVFTTAYVTASKCEPSLRTLLTGREPFPRTDEKRDLADVARARQAAAETLPVLLTKRGYASFQAGKYWLKSFASGGFSDGTKTGKDGGDSVERWMGGREGLKIGRETMQPVFDFIDRHETEPFFLWFAPKLPHRPWDAKDDVRERYAGVELTPSALAYYANISRFDDSLGELVDYIDRKGIRSRTLIVYLSDNGFRLGPNDDYEPKDEHRAKGTMSEFGFRTPLIFNWPGHVPAGVVRDDLVSTLDLFPTLLDYAGAPAPADRVGIDLRPILEKGTDVPRGEIIGRMKSVRAHLESAPLEEKVTEAYFVRSPKWHYVWYPIVGDDQLYDVESDPQEQKNLLREHPEVAAGLREKIEHWKNEARDPSR